VGIRILHLYTRQFEYIHKYLIELLEEELYSLGQEPEAKTWDDESKAYFSSLGIKTIPSPSMYTSVHYIFEAKTKTNTYTFEIQVRTLAEEIWGEVDHTLNYPHAADSLACREQIKVLARVTSSCSRLVDSIFTTSNDLDESQPKLKGNKNKSSSSSSKK
jgi:putative GTP pyrophosphokinase